MCPHFIQDFADIVSQPSLEGPVDAGLEEEEVQEESNDSDFLSPAAINTVVQIHQRLCLGYAQSLWYQSTAPANHSKEHIKALVSSYQIAVPVMSRFYHLIGQCHLFALTPSVYATRIYSSYKAEMYSCKWITYLKWSVDYYFLYFPLRRRTGPAAYRQ